MGLDYVIFSLLFFHHRTNCLQNFIYKLFKLFYIEYKLLWLFFKELSIPAFSLKNNYPPPITKLHIYCVNIPPIFCLIGRAYLFTSTVLTQVRKVSISFLLPQSSSNCFFLKPTQSPVKNPVLKPMPRVEVKERNEVSLAR